MSATWLLVAILAAAQGQALQIAVPQEPNVTAARLSWEGRVVPLVRIGEEWQALIGVDLETAPGPHAVEIVLELADGRTRTHREEIRVTAGVFPTTRLEVEPRYVELSPEDEARAARESREIEAIYATITPERFWRGRFEVPIQGARGGRNFGHRRVFNGQSRAPHSGADLTAATGTPIRAATRGRIVLAEELFFSGNAVFIDHGMGVYSAYLHLEEIQVREGDLVERGTVVGLAGATGRVTGPHLHWGVRVVGARVDPFTLLGIDME
jgi:murein DD-endopeptidase MepM/ murein hydrolase activator NlpD